MASEVAMSVPKVLDSVIVCTTSLPKKQIFSRWVITDAKIFLENRGRDGLKSPDFSVLLPKAKCGDQQQTTLWHLKVYRDMKSSGRVQQAGTSGESVRNFCIHLYQGPREDIETVCRTSEPLPGRGYTSPPISHQSRPSRSYCSSEVVASRVLITDCKFEIINSETGECMFTMASQSGSTVERKICNEYPGSCGYVSVQYADVERFLCQDTLIIQVHATLLCLSDPNESVLHEPRKPPEDNILSGVKYLFNEKLFADVTIKCGYTEFKAHKAILASQSPVFRRMLESDMKEQRTNVVEISDVDQAVISDMLAYIYTGCAPNLDTLVKDLLKVADKYELSELFAMCEDKLKADMKVANVIELLILADMHNASRLKGTCLNYIRQNSAAVLNTSQWKELKKNCDRHASLLVEIMDIALQ